MGRRRLPGSSVCGVMVSGLAIRILCNQTAFRVTLKECYFESDTADKVLKFRGITLRFGFNDRLSLCTSNQN